MFHLQAARVYACTELIRECRFFGHDSAVCSGNDSCMGLLFDCAVFAPTA
jgi:hypothetical protein